MRCSWKQVDTFQPEATEVQLAMLAQILGATQQTESSWPPSAPEVVPRLVDLEVAVPHLSPAVW